MPPRRVGGKAHVLPPNPHWLDFPRTDGDASKWPENTTRQVDGEGQVNFYRPCDLDESLAVGWRRGVAAAIAERMGLPPGPSYVLRTWPDGYQMFDHNKGPQDNPRHDAYLIGSIHHQRFRSVPEFIPHALWLMTDPEMNRSNCQCKACSKQPQRTISALLGLRNSSSPTPSAGGSASGSYAYTASQSASQSISSGPRGPRRAAAVAAAANLSAPPGAGGYPYPFGAGAAATRARGARARQAAPVNHTQLALRRVRNAWANLPKGGPREFSLPERVSDVHAVAARPGASSSSSAASASAGGEVSGGAHPRWFRVGELVWCALAPGPISGLIEYWPGLVKAYKSDTQVMSPPPGEEKEDVEMEPTDLGALAADADANAEDNSMDQSANSPDPASEKAKGKAKARAKPPPQAPFRPPLPSHSRVPNFSVRQRTIYTVRLLGVNQDAAVSDADVVPYQVYMPSIAVWVAIEPILGSESDIDWDAIATFNPMDATAALYSATSAPGVTAQVVSEQHWAMLRAAAAPYSLAVLVAAEISQHWTPTHEWEFKYPAYAPTPPDLDKGKGKARAAPDATWGSPGPALGVGEQRIAPFGGPPTGSLARVSPLASETHYQGLWWGPERIWAEDLVRLKVRRGEFGPNGSNIVRTPAGPGAATVADWLTRERVAGGGPLLDPVMTEEMRRELGASGKGLFLRIDAMHAVDARISGPDGVARMGSQCRVSGMLYELVDEDWIDVAAITPQASASATQAPSGPTGASGAAAEPSTSKLRGVRPRVPLSQPPSVHALPLPPMKYKFRAVLHPDYEVVLPVGLISGRYYPSLFDHPRPRDAVLAATGGVPNSEKYNRGLHFFALDGLTCGVHNAVDPTRWSAHRAHTADSAKESAKERLRRRWTEVRRNMLAMAAVLSDGDVKMG